MTALQRTMPAFMRRDRCGFCWPLSIHRQARVRVTSSTCQQHHDAHAVPGRTLHSLRGAARCPSARLRDSLDRARIAAERIAEPPWHGCGRSGADRRERRLALILGEWLDRRHGCRRWLKRRALGDGCQNLRNLKNPRAAMRISVTASVRSVRFTMALGRAGDAAVRCG